jgi:hypothetical protein
MERNSVEGGDDVWVVEPGGRTGLAAEPPHEASVAIQPGREDLDRDSAPEPRVVTFVPVCHSPRPIRSPELIEPPRTAVVPSTAN